MCWNLIKFLGLFQTPSHELTLSDSQTVDFVQWAPDPQTGSKINTPTATINLYRVIFDNITISTIKISVDIKRCIFKYTDSQSHIKYTYRRPKANICVEVKTEEQKQLFINKANIIFSGCIAKALSSSFETLIIVKNFNSLI